MKSLRHVVIGVGAGVINMHEEALHLPTVDLVAVSDINTEAGERRAREFGCTFYEDYRHMLEKERPDVTIITTPHPFHAQIAINALRAGSHVLVEKPMAVQVAEADAMIAAARENQKLLGVVFQHRFRPEVQTAYRLIQDGKLGDIQHVEMNRLWPRPESYFRTSPWRGTWKGEGGGVLMNQASHNLDVLCFLAGGLPQRVHAWTRRLLHDIETEDTAQAIFEWPNGALGSFHTSTAQMPQPEYLKLVGTRGYLEIISNELSLYLSDNDFREFSATSPEPFSSPKLKRVEVELTQGKGNHASVYRNFHEAILNGSTFTSEGEQGRMELELANAMIYASYTHSEVELPLDRQQYATLLENLRKESTR